jgi:2-polyprenyl-3-methyl-5-hydroxy-6-metoxy-1,4-benzoquinol methylase
MKTLTGNRGLDAGCGDMANRRYFRTAHYVGVDADSDRLNEAVRQLGHVRVSAVASTIEDLDESYASDVVICVQVIGANTNFEHAKAASAVDKLIHLTKPGGTLIVNTGAKCSQTGIEENLRRSFASVTVRRYGRMTGELFPLLSLMAAFLMDLVPALRGDGPKAYFLCRGRRHHG